MVLGLLFKSSHPHQMITVLAHIKKSPDIRCLGFFYVRFLMQIKLEEVTFRFDLMSLSQFCLAQGRMSTIRARLQEALLKSQGR
jgi:hypothetical protein